jgi:hypothetical protein
MYAHTFQEQLDEMLEFVSASKQVVDDIMDGESNKLLTEQMSSECSETFFYICLGREDCLPGKHQANLVPYYSAVLENDIDAARERLKYILLASNKPRTPNQQSEYLLELFKNVHKKIHPNGIFIAAKNITENSEQANSGPNILTLSNGPVSPQHVKKMMLVILSTERAVRDTLGPMLGHIDGQVMYELTQAFFYASLELEKYLPQGYLDKVVPYMKAFMIPNINAAKLVWVEIGKDLAVVPNDFLLPQLITLFKIAAKGLYPDVEFLSTTDVDRLPMN